MPEDLGNWFREKKPSLLHAAAELADDYTTARWAVAYGGYPLAPGSGANQELRGKENKNWHTPGDQDRQGQECRVLGAALGDPDWQGQEGGVLGAALGDQDRQGQEGGVLGAAPGDQDCRAKMVGSWVRLWRTKTGRANRVRSWVYTRKFGWIAQSIQGVGKAQVYPLQL